MLDSDDLLLIKIETFLNRLQLGEFQSDEELAIEELNILCQNETAKNYFIGEHLPGLLNNTRSGWAHVSYYVGATIQYSAPSLAHALTISLIQKYAQYPNEEILSWIVNLILQFKFSRLLSIENEGRSVRFGLEEVGFTVRIELIRPELKLDLLRLAIVKYSRLLTENGPPSAQEVQAIVHRLNTVIKLISHYEPAELKRHTSLFALGIVDNISYSSRNSYKLFDKKHSPFAYDEIYFENYRVPLLPIINKDKAHG